MPFGSPLLVHLIKNAAIEISHPYTYGKTLWDARLDEGDFPEDILGFEPVSGRMMADVQVIAQYETWKTRREGSNLSIELLGGGSDFAPFSQLLGVSVAKWLCARTLNMFQIPSMDEVFGETPYSAAYHYHSIYDSLLWQERYADPEFKRHVRITTFSA